MTGTSNAFIVANPAGYECTDYEICPEETAVAKLCPPGKYTSDDTSTYARPLETEDACLNCPDDYYCPDWGITGTGCVGAHCKPYTDYPCPAGYLCYNGAIHPSDRDDVTVAFCPVGNFCNKAIGNQVSQ